MANTQGSDKTQITLWTTDRQLHIPAAIPATSTIFYAAQAVGRDINDNMTQMDDTAPRQFCGFLIDMVRTQVDPIDTIQTNGLTGDKEFDIIQPQEFTVLIASAVAGDSNRNVYWKFNNEVSYSPGASGNLAGQVWFVKDSTHVCVVPPWMLCDLFGSAAVQTLSGTTSPLTLTKFDTGKTFLLPSTVSQTINLPSAGKLGSGNQLIFIQTGTSSSVVTFVPNGTDVINSTAGWAAASFALGASRGSRLVLETDGISNWYQVG